MFLFESIHDFVLENFSKHVTQSAGLVVIGTSALLLFLRKFLSTKTPPPGPWGYPIVGHLPMLGTRPDITLSKMRKKYGDIIKLRFGSQPTVVLSGPMIKEALCNRGDAFSGRPQVFSTMSVHGGKGLSFGMFDKTWKMHKRIATCSFNTFANAKNNPIEEIIVEQVDILIAEFESLKTKPFDPHDQVFTAVAGIIYQLCYGQRENIRSDKNFLEYILLTQAFSKFVSAGNVIDSFPWLKIFYKKEVDQFMDVLERGNLIRRKRISEHRKSFDAEHLRDITDSLLKACEDLSEDDASGMTEERILSSIGDLFAAGFDTVATTTLWMILYLVKNPEVQKRIQSELDEHLGTRPPSLSDRGKMTYIEATIHEIMRIINLTPLSTPHSTTTDVELGGYTIEKDSIVIVNLFSLSHDPDVWGDPENFRPERFLTETGEINKRLVELFLPFSAGRRRCLGESLARMEVFLILTGLMQRFTFVKPASVPGYTMDSTFGLNVKPLSYLVEVQPRSG